MSFNSRQKQNKTRRKNKKVENEIKWDTFFSNKEQTVVMSREFFEDLVFDKIDVPSQPVYHGDVNAFVLEIFTMRDEMKCRWSRNFVEAAFECFPEMDYCVILLPFSHPFLPLLKHFVVRCVSFTFEIHVSLIQPCRY